MARPNILYIHSHDTGRYVQPYGHSVHTPNIQRVAEEGVLFRQCFCGGPTCSPSRAALLTGQCAHSSGMLGLAHRGFFLYDYRQHLIHTLRDAGYHTVLCGVQHVAASASDIGYDRIYESRGEADLNAAKVLLDSPKQPFFLSVGFGQTHRAYPPHDAKDDPRYSLPPAPLPDTPETREDMACFKTSARMLDRKMGYVFDALDRTGLGGNTLVICTTDHGIAFPRMKCNLTDHGIGVMLIMRGPGGFTGGKVVDGLVSQSDIFPTLCELLDIAPPSWLQGVSFLPLVNGQAEEVNEQIFAEVTYHAAYEPMRCVRTRTWKYIRRFDPRLKPVLPNIDDSVSKTLMMNQGWRDMQYSEEELYDLVLDPHELCNVVGKGENSDVLRNMRARLQRWMEETDDPLLNSPDVPAPKGARVNSSDGISPREKPRIVE